MTGTASRVLICDRIKFPDRNEVQANFAPREKIERLYSFVESILDPAINGMRCLFSVLTPIRQEMAAVHFTSEAHSRSGE